MARFHSMQMTTFGEYDPFQDEITLNKDWLGLWNRRLVQAYIHEQFHRALVKQGIWNHEPYHDSIRTRASEIVKLLSNIEVMQIIKALINGNEPLYFIP